MTYNKCRDGIVIKVTPAFDKGSKNLTDKEKGALYDFLARNPNSGTVIKGTGGVRKLRWRSLKSNKGKSGGCRILYHFSNDVLIILLLLYSKAEKENISPKEKSELKKLIPKLVKKYMEEVTCKINH